jgi:hypothetical protein|tara:strand:- start:263 stop:661 length:399 start_codon:yes stop_codon:yes gene_type:complete
MGTQSYKNGYADKLIFWNEQLILSQTESIERPRYSEEKCKESILYFTEKHEQWKIENEGSNPRFNPLTYYTGSELKWSTEDVMRNAEHLDIKLTEEQALSILLATFKDNDSMMEYINNEISDTIANIYSDEQ